MPSSNFGRKISSQMSSICLFYLYVFLKIDFWFKPSITVTMKEMIVQRNEMTMMKLKE